MSDPTNIPQIAAGLSEAQRRAIMDIDDAYAITEALAQLYQDGFASIDKAAGHQWMELTEEGQAVRQYLKENGNTR